jgi:hypothetical protein
MHRYNFDMRTELEQSFFGQSDSSSMYVHMQILFQGQSHQYFVRPYDGRIRPYQYGSRRVPATRQPVTVPQRAERCRYGDGNRITDTVYTAFTGYGGQPYSDAPPNQTIRGTAHNRTAPCCFHIPSLPRARCPESDLTSKRMDIMCAPRAGSRDLERPHFFGQIRCG